MNGVDNGFMLFTNYRVPRECLLNKHGDVSPGGEYVKARQHQKDGKGGGKGYNASLGALAVGRIAITGRYKIIFLFTEKSQRNFGLVSQNLQQSPSRWPPQLPPGEYSQLPLSE